MNKEKFFNLEYDEKHRKIKGWKDITFFYMIVSIIVSLLLVFEAVELVNYTCVFLGLLALFSASFAAIVQSRTSVLLSFLCYGFSFYQITSVNTNKDVYVVTVVIMMGVSLLAIDIFHKWQICDVDSFIKEEIDEA